MVYTVFRKRLQQYDKSRREVLVALVLLFLIAIAGTVGFMFIEGWSFLDGIYMTFITLTTIGFTEIHELSSGGRIWIMVIAFFGIGTGVFIFSRMTEMIITERRFFFHRMHKEIERLEDHYIICGFGRVGAYIAHFLTHESKPFVIIELNDQKIEAIERLNYLYIQGDAEVGYNLELAGIKKAKGIVLTLPEDRDNAFATLMARELNQKIYIVARASHENNVPKLKRAGADKVLSPYVTGAAQMAQSLVRPRAYQFFERAHQIESLDLQVEEINILPQADIVGKSLKENNFRQQFGLIVIAIYDAEKGKTTFNPEADFRLEVGQTLVVMGNSEMIARLRIKCSSG